MLLSKRNINQQKKIKTYCKIEHLEAHNDNQSDPHFFDEFLEKWKQGVYHD